MELGLSNKHVLVTGGAGGIGQSIVKLLHQEGAKISLHYNKSKDKACQIKDQLNSNSLALIQGDLGKETDVERIFQEAIDYFGRVDSLVANAGIWAPEYTFTDKMNLDRWEKTLRVNLTGVFLCVREFFRNLQTFKEDTASIVLVGSTAGQFGEAGYADYSATKAALMYGLTKTWKNEIVTYSTLGRINCVAPGWVFTEMAEKSLREEGKMEKIFQTMPLKKIAQVEDIASIVVFLLSEKTAGHISGETIMVHGGMEGRVL
jgi:NAD(P)-dependent dehydrogenase (short-subunit alcohol dehydrogenase family)